jgi:hypothetical protein
MNNAIGVFRLNMFSNIKNPIIVAVADIVLCKKIYSVVLDRINDAMSKSDMPRGMLLIFINLHFKYNHATRKPNRNCQTLLPSRMIDLIDLSCSNKKGSSIINIEHK